MCIRKELPQPQSDYVIEGDGREFGERAAKFTCAVKPRYKLQLDSRSILIMQYLHL